MTLNFYQSLEFGLRHKNAFRFWWIDLFDIWASLVGDSVSEESACTAGDLGSVLGSGSFPGEGSGNPLQYSCLENPMDRGSWQAMVHGVTRVRQDVATELPPTTTTIQLIRGFPDGSVVRNLPAMQELQKIRVQYLGWPAPLEKQMGTLFLAWNPMYSCLKNPINRGTWWATVRGQQRVGHDRCDWARGHTGYRMNNAKTLALKKYIAALTFLSVARFGGTLNVRVYENVDILRKARAIFPWMSRKNESDICISFPGLLCKLTNKYQSK